MRSAIVVEPTRSQNITVTSLRSPATTPWLARILAASVSGIAGVDASGTLSAGRATLAAASAGAGVPHSGQNRNPGSIAFPQPVHTIGARVPHAWQKALPGINSVEQLTQRTVTTVAVILP